MQTGIYVKVPSDPILPVVDSNTAVPNGPTGMKFQAFKNVSLDGNNIAFVGGGAFFVEFTTLVQEGVYKDIGSGWQVVADLNTVVPGQATAFSTFGAVAIDPGRVAGQLADAGQPDLHEDGAAGAAQDAVPLIPP